MASPCVAAGGSCTGPHRLSSGEWGSACAASAWRACSVVDTARAISPAARAYVRSQECLAPK
eukprot:4572502-Alexandrium_andersonii.AAC.1